MSGKKRLDASSTPGFANDKLAAALRARGLAPPPPPSSPDAAPETPPPEEPRRAARAEKAAALAATAPPAPDGPLARAAKVIVRLERKGRGGKTITLVEAVPPLASAAAEEVRGLRRSLGCGAAAEGAAVVFQGDHRERLPDLLAALGAKRVVRSG